jgi:5-methylthioadenosine/S-adenosylhomocysteine deaminase
VGTTGELVSRFRAGETIDASDCALLPGLIDAHMHTPLAIVRGVAQDVAHWMQRALAPYSAQITPAAALAGTRLNVLEALKSGTTTFVDCTRPYPGWAQVFDQMGVRARLTPTISALPPGGMARWKVGDLYPFDPAAGLAAIQAAVTFAHEWHGAANGRITAMIGPQAPDMLPRDQLLQVKESAERLGLMIHMHVAQGDREIDQMLKRYGQRTPAFLDQLGYLDPQLLAVHLTEATDEEADLVARRGARLALCSGSIGIIDGIVPPARAFRAAGGLVALGSDQACGNNCNNLFNEMKLTALFNKIKYRDRVAGAAWQLSRRTALAWGQSGSLVVGKQAGPDRGRPVRPTSPVLQAPVRNIAQPGLLPAGAVTTVMVAGGLSPQRSDYRRRGRGRATRQPRPCPGAWRSAHERADPAAARWPALLGACGGGTAAWPQTVEKRQRPLRLRPGKPAPAPRLISAGLTISWSCQSSHLLRQVRPQPVKRGPMTSCSGVRRPVALRSLRAIMRATMAPVAVVRAIT